MKTQKPIWTTTVDPSEYDYVAQFTLIVEWANKNEEPYPPTDVGKVWGLVQAYQRLERENTALREVLNRWKEICEMGLPDVVMPSLKPALVDLWDATDTAINAARKEGPAMSDTPRTDAMEIELRLTYDDVAFVNFARELERENAEQCVLLGKGGERECALLGKVERLERENAELRRDVYQCPPTSENDYEGLTWSDAFEVLERDNAALRDDRNELRTALFAQQKQQSESNREWAQESAELKIRLGVLERENAALREKMKVSWDEISVLVNQNSALLEALKTIAKYDQNSPHGDGICPYGCDCPSIANTALIKARKEAQP